MLAPLASVLGRTPLSQQAGTRACTELRLARFSRLPIEVTYFLYFSSGSRIGLNLKSTPAPLGLQRSICGP